MMTTVCKRGGIYHVGTKLLLTALASLFLGIHAFGEGVPVPSSADRLGWQMAIHGRTFQAYGLWEAMSKTAQIGIKYMSLPAG